MLKIFFGALLASLAPSVRAAEAVQPVLLVAEDDNAAARLERGLNDGSDRLFAVISVNPAKLASVAASLTARGMTPLIARDEPLEKAIKELRERAGARAEAPASPAARAAAFRRVAAAHGVFGDPVGARDGLSGVLEWSPDDLDALDALAALSLAGDRRWQALAYVDRAAAAKGAPVARRAAALRKAGELRLQLGDFTGAEKDLSRAAKLVPADSGLLYMLAEAAQDRPEAALPLALRAAATGAKAPDRARANLLAALLRFDLGDAAGARKSAARALEDAPDDLDALAAMVRFTAGRKAEAAPFAERAAAAASRAPLWQRAAAFRLAARVWLELGEHDRSAQALGRALTFNPEDVDALVQLMRIRTRLAPERLAGLRRAALAAGREAEAPAKAASEDDEKRALEADPDDLEALRRLIALHKDGNRPDEAAAYAERFARAVWKAPVWLRGEAERSVASLWLDLGREDMAARALARALDLQSDSIETWRMVVKLPDFTPNQPTFTGLSAVYVKAAELRVALDDRAGAKEDLDAALKFQPGHAGAQRLLESLKKTP